MVNAFALDFGTLLSAIDPTGLLTVQLPLCYDISAGCCFFYCNGSRLPTTATYHTGYHGNPALAVLGVDAMQTHFFVFYYGVLADITPPVALAAYAGAIAQAI